MSANNSISQLLEQFLELNTNSLETFERINEAITTDSKEVYISLYNNKTGETSEVKIPAFGYLKREIERLDTNIKAISSVDSANSNVRLADGTYRRIYTSKLKGPAKPITSLSTPTEFDTKLNDFFEDFLNPLLTINLEVTGQIPVETERVYVERFLFDSNDTITTDYFDTTYKSLSDIQYESFIRDIKDEKLKYHKDSNVVDMPIRNVQFTGTFDVNRIDIAQSTEVINGVSQAKTVKLFTINKLSYSDSSKTMQDTEVLKVGDFLAVNSDAFSTRYRIEAIDHSRTQIQLKLIEGFEGITHGANFFKIYKGIENSVSIDINVGFDERQVVFIKPIDPISKITADLYSPGIGFYSNELKLELPNGDNVTLSEYYKNEVADFGQFIKSLKVDYIPPASVALKPDAPVLDLTNFKVVQINKHLTENSTTDRIVKLKADKISAEQSIKTSDSAIKKKRTLMSTKKFRSNAEKSQHESELSSLISKRSDTSKLFASLVSDIKSTAVSSQVSSVKPKYRTRGFWSVPPPKSYGEELSQDIIQFIIRYRYLSSNGKSSSIEQISFNDVTSQVTKTGAFSNWIETKTNVKTRIFNDDTNTYEWVFESEEDGQAINFNSLDISLSPGEIVEVMIKSVSEAGYPANPITSDWSDSIKIEFPEEFSVDSVTGMINGNEMDSIKVDIMDDLEARGVYSHISDSTNIFLHSATSISSGFLSPEQSPISLYDKLIDLQLEIERLKDIIVGATGELVVKIIDPLGNITQVQRNSVIRLHGGYYTNEVSDNTNFKGEIITKNFRIELSNSKATQLEINAIISGDRTSPAYTSTNNTVFGLGNGTIGGNVIGNVYYTSEGKYDLVPVGYQNNTIDDIDANHAFNTLPSQSSQTTGQFIYSRYTSIAGDKSLYSVSQLNISDSRGYYSNEYGASLSFYGGSNNTLSPPDYSTVPIGWESLGSFASQNISGGAAGDYGLWDGDVNSNTPSAHDPSDTEYDNGIFVHQSHPLTSTKSITDMIISGDIGMPRTATLTTNDILWYQQSAFKPIISVEDTNADPLVYTQRRAVKIAFTANDKYLLGGKSCGSFLYLAPIDKRAITVDADNKFGRKRISTGDGNAIAIDLIWQYRMTDYNGTGDTGVGLVHGLTSNPSNVTYSKTVGFDIAIPNSERFSFDVELTSSYKPTGTGLTSIPQSSIINYG